MLKCSRAHEMKLLDETLSQTGDPSVHLFVYVHIS